MRDDSRRAAKPIRVHRRAFFRSACIGATALVALVTYAAHMAHRVSVAEAAAAAAAHESSLRLVHLAMELQSELDAQEDHDRWTLQLYLRLERETLPKVHHEVTSALQSCPSVARAAAEKALGDLGEDAHRHSHAMLEALQRQGARARKRAHELASDVLAQARADRERLRERSGEPWSDSDLEAPLKALARTLRRPNATFELPLDLLAQWESAARDALSEGGAVSSAVVRRLVELATASPLPTSDRMRAGVLALEDPTSDFVGLLQRARLHRHLPELLHLLGSWEAHRSTVWDVIERIEMLRVHAHAHARVHGECVFACMRTRRLGWHALVIWRWRLQAWEASARGFTYAHAHAHMHIRKHVRRRSTCSRWASYVWRSTSGITLSAMPPMPSEGHRTRLTPTSEMASNEIKRDGTGPHSFRYLTPTSEIDRCEMSTAFHCGGLSL